MTSGNQPCPSIIYQSLTETVALIDIPTSIAIAQSLPKPVNHDQSWKTFPTLRSCPPLQEPYPSLEPKSGTARANVLARQGAQVDDREFLKLIREGLDEIRKDHRGDWCLPRIFVSEGRILRKRRQQVIEDEKASEEQREMEPDWASLSQENVAEMAENAFKIVNLATITHSRNGVAIDLVLQELSSSIIYNSNLAPIPIAIPTTPPSTYIIPPHSAFSLSHINSATASAFSVALVDLKKAPITHSHPPLSSKFNLIILDPPWHNKSITRSRHYSTQRDDPLSCLRPILGIHIAENGVVACWITNKATARADALECFRIWNVRLIEEWVWLKVTVKGEPVYDVEGVWRKPFEVLLVGRKMGDEDTGSGDCKDGARNKIADSRECVTGERGAVRRQLIVGVPDLHSRKPSLRRLMEPVVGMGEDYRALEVFARNLTAGWMAWGDEVLKFSWEQHWIEAKNNLG